MQKSRNRDHAQEWAEAYAAVFPPYQLLIESYLEAQEVVKRNETPSASLLVARDSTAPVARPAPIGKGIE